MTNPAMEGCSDGESEWQLWWSIVAGFHFFAGIFLHLAPSNLMPYMGKAKYFLLHPFSGLQDLTEHDWDPVSVWATEGGAGNLMAIGLFALWATDPHEDYSFAVAVIATEGVAILGWLYTYLKYLDHWSWTIFFQLFGHLAVLVLGIILAGDYRTDDNVLVSGGGKIHAGRLLWSIFGVRALHTALLVCDAIVKDTSSFYLKEGLQYETRFGNAMMTLRAATSVHVMLILLHAALRFEGGTPDFHFPLAFWAGQLGTYLSWMVTYCVQEDMWRPHHIVFFASVQAALVAITVALWYSDCHDD